MNGKKIDNNIFKKKLYKWFSSYYESQTCSNDIIKSTSAVIEYLHLIHVLESVIAKVCVMQQSL